MLFLVTKIQGYETIAAGNPDEELHKDRRFIAVTLTFIRRWFGNHVPAVRYNPNLHRVISIRGLVFIQSAELSIGQNQIFRKISRDKYHNPCNADFAKLILSWEINRYDYREAANENTSLPCDRRVSVTKFL